MTKWTRLRRFAVVRIVLEAVVVFITAAVASRVIGLVIPPGHSTLHAVLTALRNLCVAGLVLFVYRVMVRWLEKREATELSGILRPLPFGVLLGIGLMAVVYGILAVANIASFSPGTGLAGLALGLIAMFLAAVFEETLFRGVLFRTLEEAFGTTAALLSSAALFGLAHGLNPGATLFSDLAIAIEAGLLLGTAYGLSGNLWLPIGIHAGWNFAESNLFGAQVSGNLPAQSLIHATLAGSPLLTGGAFGPEASLVSIAVCGCAAAVLGIQVARRGNWRPRRFRLVLADGPTASAV